jgi:hypothetical protein
MEAAHRSYKSIYSAWKVGKGKTAHEGMDEGMVTTTVLSFLCSTIASPHTYVHRGRLAP